MSVVASSQVAEEIKLAGPEGSLSVSWLTSRPPIPAITRDGVPRLAQDELPSTSLSDILFTNCRCDIQRHWAVSGKQESLETTWSVVIHGHVFQTINHPCLGLVFCGVIEWWWWYNWSCRRFLNRRLVVQLHVTTKVHTARKEFCTKFEIVLVERISWVFLHSPAWTHPVHLKWKLPRINPR